VAVVVVAVVVVAVVVVAVVVAVPVVPVPVVPVPVVPVPVVVATADAAAWAGTTTDLTIGATHLLGSKIVAMPPTVANFKMRRRSEFCLEVISPRPR
jgi:hypothetical protein